MILFLGVLAIRFVTSDKLNQAYLPPPGAKYAGGYSEDLLTPFEYPEEVPRFVTENNKNLLLDRTKNQNPDFSDGIPGSYEIEAVGKEILRNHSHYTQTTESLRNKFNTFPVMEYKTLDPHKYLPDYSYPNNEPVVQQVRTSDFFGTDGYHYEKPSTTTSLGSQIPELTGPFLTDNLSTKPKINQLTTANPVITNINQRNHVRKTKQKSNRPQSKLDFNPVTNNYKNVMNPDKYSYSFDTSNGIHMDESASLVNGVKAMGSYSYTGDDGNVYSVIYSADENGFQPKGNHLPTPPPIPAAIQMIIEQAKKDKEAGIFHDGFYDEEKYGHKKYEGPVNRYLLKIQDNLELKNRNRGFNQKKTYVKSEYMKNAQVNEYQETESRQKVFDFIAGFNGQFGMKKSVPVEQTRTKPMKKLNIENVKNHRRPMKNNQQDHFMQKLVNHSAANIDKPKNGIKNKANHRNSLVKNKNSDNHTRSKQYKEVSSDIDQNQDSLKSTSSDLGYFYIPPRKVFIEGRLQDTSINLNKAQNNRKGIESMSIPVSGFYYVDQRDKNGTSYFTSTIKPDMSKNTYGNDFYESTIQDIDQSIFSLGAVSTTNDINITTSKTYDGITMNTSIEDLDSIKDGGHEEETVSQDENDVPLTRDGLLDTTNLSTTPMSVETKYTLDNQYKTAKPIEFDSTLPNGLDTNSENGGYLRAKPDITETYEDIPSSTYMPCTEDRLNLETIPNIKVDGFGKPIRDSLVLNTNTPYYGYFTTEPVSNDADYSNSFESSTETSDEQIVSRVDKVDFGYQQEKATKDSEKDTGRVIGEDFSGPKQPERFDPVLGYFY